MMVKSIITIIIIMFAASFLLGVFALKGDDSCGYFPAFAHGFVVSQFVFHIISIIGIAAGTSFTDFTAIYIFLLILSAILSVFSWGKNHAKGKNNYKGLTIYECFLFLLFLGILAFQIYRTITYDTTYMSYDDYLYVAYGNAAIYDDKMMATHFVFGKATGIELGGSTIKYLLETIIFFEAFLAKVFELPITMIAHTIFPVYLLILSYIVLYCLSSQLFEEMEDRLIFMILSSLLFLFGHYSIYSTTFRLLGPIWQGKAILAVIVFPFLLFIITTFMKRDYTKLQGFEVLMCSVAAVSMTMNGIVVVAAVLAIIVIISCLKKMRPSKHLLYLAWGGVYPALVTLFYLVNR